MDQTQAAPETHITYYGGKWVAFAPILLAIVGLIYIAVKQADVPEYWVVFLLPMIVCLFLAKDKTAYCEAIIEGATNKVGGILIMAVLLAGICGQLVCQAVEQRCLARSVWPDQSHNFSLLDIEADVFYSCKTSKIFRYVFDGQQEHITPLIVK